MIDHSDGRFRRFDGVDRNWHAYVVREAHSGGTKLTALAVKAPFYGHYHQWGAWVLVEGQKEPWFHARDAHNIDQCAKLAEELLDEVRQKLAEGRGE